MATDLKTQIENTVNELNRVFTSLKTHADSNTALSGTNKTDLETDLDHVKDSTKTHKTTKLDLGLEQLKNLANLIGDEKSQLVLKQTQLEQEKKTLEDDKKKVEQEKQDEINKHQKTKLEVADKLTSDLVNGLNTLINTGLKKPKKDASGNDVKDANGNIVYEDIFDIQKIDAIKKVVDDLKTSGAKIDLSSLDSKFSDLGNKVETSKSTKEPKETNYWSIGACAGSAIAVILLGYIAFFKPSNGGIMKQESKE